MKHWRKTSGVRIGRVASSFSLAVLAAIAIGGQYGDLDAKLRAASTTSDKVQILRDSNISDDDLSAYVNKAQDGSAKSVNAAVEFVNLRAMAERAGTSPDQSGQVRGIKKSPLYGDEKAPDQANWLIGAVERMKNLVPRREARPQTGTNMPAIGFPAFLIYFVWFLLGAAVLAFIVYALRFVSFSKLKKRKAKAMLEDDEPERTLDEWLALAESFEREGRYREAVRALYLACLLKFDERNIARFMRSQTNWEHLARIDDSPRRPANLDFRAPTQAFDRIWYGHKVRGADDVEDFKAWYGQVTRALQEAAA